jgi:chemotaxis response regulator CheB
VASPASMSSIGNEMNQPSREPVTPRLIAIASSVGLEPLFEVLGNLPHEFPVPILMLPSIHPDYVKSRLRRLHNRTGSGDIEGVWNGKIGRGDQCCLRIASG